MSTNADDDGILVVDEMISTPQEHSVSIAAAGGAAEAGGEAEEEAGARVLRSAAAAAAPRSAFSLEELEDNTSNESSLAESEKPVSSAAGTSHQDDAENSTRQSEHTQSDAAPLDSAAVAREKLLQAAQAAAAVTSVAAAKSAEVAAKVSHDVAAAAARVAEAAGTAVRRFTTGGNQSTASASPLGTDEPVGTDTNTSPEGDGSEENGNGSGAIEVDKRANSEGLWGAVRRMSGSAAAQASAAASAAYKATEPVAQATANGVIDLSKKVADGAKSAITAAEPIAQATATRVSEGATSAWVKTKEGTTSLWDRARRLSLRKPAASPNGDGTSSPGGDISTATHGIQVEDETTSNESGSSAVSDPADTPSPDTN